MDSVNKRSKQPVLVSDFDGTMTQYDFYQLAQQQLVPAETPDYWGEFLAGRLTHFAALQAIFRSIRADEATIMATARQMQLDLHLCRDVARLREAGWNIVVASAGCAWYIQRLVAEAGVENLTVHANPGTVVPDRGLLMEPPVDSPFYSPETGISKEAVVRNAVATHAQVAFAGDGRPDLPAAMLVPPERRFARGWLAEHLTHEGIHFHRFDLWSEVVTSLLGG
ncbi:MAG TPA: HAD-IB family phosphatase [Armatimonadota bacterium]|nr:HAD-IB family phosphatase [Armatimonadota bacterium]